MAELLHLVRPRRVTMRDPSLPHQIVLGVVPGNSHLIYISCNCQGRKPRQGPTFYEPLAAPRGRWEPHEPMEIWRAHMTEVSA
jgi:hypothetical protein